MWLIFYDYDCHLSKMSWVMIFAGNVVKYFGVKGPQIKQVYKLLG